MAEAYHYFKGLAPYAGSAKIKADFTGNGRVSRSGLSRVAVPSPRSSLR